VVNNRSSFEDTGGKTNAGNETDLDATNEMGKKKGRGVIKTTGIIKINHLLL